MYDHFVAYYNRIFPFDEDLKTLLIDYITPDGFAVDLGCGTGRLVDLLHSMKMNAEGVDLNQAMIEYAKHTFPHLLFHHMSMVEFLTQSKTYQLITCFGNTLPHLNQDELHLFFHNLKKSLHPQGYALIQLLNYTHILNEKPHMLKPILFEGGSFIREYTYHEKSITFQTTLKLQESITTDQTTLYPYTKDQLVAIIEKHHLSVKAYADFDQSVWTENGYVLSLVITQP